jgi:C-terminal processing protease CtpA/Prc
MMSVADQKVKAAMERIKARRKEGWLQHMLNEVEKIDAGINDLHKVGDNLDKLEEVFKTIDTKLNDEKSKDNSNLYKEIYTDLSGAIKEHMHILTNHAKEQLAKEMEEE